MKKSKQIISLIAISSLLTTSLLIYHNNINANQSDDYSYATSTLPENTIFTNIDKNGQIKEVSQNELQKDGYVHLTPSISFYSLVNNDDVLVERGVVNFRIKSSASQNTLYEEEQTGKEGYTNGYYAADGAYLGHNEDRTKVKFMLAGVIGWVDANEVQVLDFSDPAVKTLSKYFVENGKLYHGICTNLNSTKYASEIYVGSKPQYLKEGGIYYSYDGHYFYDYNNTKGYITMLKDYRQDTRENAVNKDNPYYNYYQFLPHRSQTFYQENELDKAIDVLVKNSEKSKNVTSKLRDLGSSLIENQNNHGINALLTLGIAANESAWGTSHIAQTKNNLFGHGAVDSNPYYSSNGYANPSFSVYYHTNTFLSKGYCSPKDWRYNGSHLGDKASGINVKYASDPYWGEKAARYAWSIDEYLNSQDSYSYSLAIKDTYNYHFTKTSLKKEANSSSTTLYQSKTTGNEIITNYPVILLNSKTTNGFYKIQSDATLNDNRSEIEKVAEYSFDKDYVYINAKDLKIINTNQSSSKEDEVLPTHEDILDHLKLKSNDNYLSGFVLGDNISNLITSLKAFAPQSTIEFKDSNGTIITKGTISTNQTLSITTNKKTIKYICVVRGDVNGDGKISALDYVKIRNHLDKVTTLKNAYLKAADVDNNNKISALDYVKTRNHLDKKSTILQ